MYVIETMLPDGPHWYAGIKKEQKGEAVIIGPLWSPYWEDRLEVDSIEEATVLLNDVLRKRSGFEIIEAEKAMSYDGRREYENCMYAIRAKYLQKGWKVYRMNKYYTVHEKTSKEIILHLSDYSDAPVMLSANSSEWIKVIAEAKPIVNDQTN